MIPYACYNAVLTLALLAATGVSALTGLWQIAVAALGLDLALRAGLTLANLLATRLTGCPLISGDGGAAPAPGGRVEP